MECRGAREGHNPPTEDGSETRSRSALVKVKDAGECHMSVTRKLLLNSFMWPIDAVLNFNHIFFFPIVQTLGLPLSLTSLVGFIAAPSAVVLIPLIGWLTDKGSNPQRRKAIAMVGGAGVSILGMTCLIVANLMHLRYLEEYKECRLEAAEHNGTGFYLAGTVCDVVIDSNVSGGEDDLFMPPFSEDSRDISLIGNGSSTTINWSSGTIPLKAYLAVFSFVLMSIGFDCSYSFAKTFVLDCTPRAHQTSVLILGFIMSSAGGVSTAALGLIDFTSLLGMDYEGGRLTIQTTVQGIVIIAFTVVFLAVSLLTGRSQKRRMALEQQRLKLEQESPDLTYTSLADVAAKETGICLKDGQRFKDEGLMQSSSEMQDTERRSCGSDHEGSAPSERTPLIGCPKQRHRTRHVDDVDIAEDGGSVMTCGYPQGSSLSIDNPCYEDDDFNTTLLDNNTTTRGTSAIVEYSNTTPRGTPAILEYNSTPRSTPTFLEYNPSPRGTPAFLEYVLQDSNTKRQTSDAMEPNGDKEGFKNATKNTDGERLIQPTTDLAQANFDIKSARKRLTTAKIRIFVLFLSLFFSDATVTMFTMTNSDFIGKAIYMGDPNAAPGSPALKRYQQGMENSSWGFLAYFLSYMLYSIAHTKILTFIGRRLEFVLAQPLMGMMMVTLAQTARLEVYYCLAIVAGLHRAVAYSIPFTVANDIIQSTVTPTGEHQLRAGFTMSIVLAVPPLAYSCLFTWVGPLEALTGNPAVPMYLAGAFSCISAVIFLCLGKV